MKYTVQMASDGMIYTPNFMKIIQSNIKVITSIISVAAMLVLLMGEIYGVSSSDGIRCHDTHTKIHRESLANLKVIWGDKHTYPQSHKHRQQSDPISIFLFFQNEESRLQNNVTSNCILVLSLHTQRLT
jgi:hypothetical protein